MKKTLLVSTMVMLLMIACGGGNENIVTIKAIVSQDNTSDDVRQQAQERGIKKAGYVWVVNDDTLNRTWTNLIVTAEFSDGSSDTEIWAGYREFTDTIPSLSSTVGIPYWDFWGSNGMHYPMDRIPKIKSIRLDCKLPNSRHGRYQTDSIPQGRVKSESEKALERYTDSLDKWLKAHPDSE